MHTFINCYYVALFVCLLYYVFHSVFFCFGFFLFNKIITEVVEDIIGNGKYETVYENFITIILC